MNEAVAETTSPFVLLLNDDTEVVYDDWLEAMVGYAQDERVGAVGGQLVYPDGTIHSAGMLLGARAIAENRYHRRPELTRGYGNRAQLPQDLSAVVGTSMLVRRTAFDEVGGLDTSFPVAYNDVDFCLKLRRAGWRVLYVPDGVLLHQGSASFETHQLGRAAGHDSDAARMARRWRDALRDDPTHNPNLALDAAYPSRLAYSRGSNTRGGCPLLYDATSREALAGGCEALEPRLPGFELLPPIRHRHDRQRVDDIRGSRAGHRDELVDRLRDAAHVRANMLGSSSASTAPGYV